MLSTHDAFLVGNFVAENARWPLVAFTGKRSFDSFG